ncbi:MAG: MlaD family protein [Myxococcota bacterium]|nr:MlaD family protein [Myxococcota bacterium]
MSRKEEAIEVKVGALVLFCLALLVGFLLLLGDFGFGDRATIYVDFTDSAGLKPGADVKQGGMSIGRVKAIRFMGGETNPQTGEAIWARVELDIDAERLPYLRESSEFGITTEGVLGEKFVSVYTPEMSAPAAESGAIFRGVDPPRLDDVVVKLSRSLDNLNALLGSEELPVAELLGHVDELVLNANAVLLENRPELTALLGDTRRFVQRADETLEQGRDALLPLLERAGHLADDAQAMVLGALRLLARLERELGPTLDTFTALVERADGFIVQLSAIVEELRPKLASLLDDAQLAALDVRSASAGMASIVDELQHGEGSIARLLRDEEIFDDLREMLRELKRRPWKLIWKE